ncbi:MAG: M48 family metallopeptidase [Rickettsiales bacterium]|nr:M48 family metallopeptidase [Rickettsiales bacterium]
MVGEFRDGLTSKSISTNINVEIEGILLVGPDIFWKFDDIRIVQNPDGDFNGVITNHNQPDQRLIINSPSLFYEIIGHISGKRVNFIYLKEFIQDHFKMLLIVAIAIVTLPFSLQFLSSQIDDEFMKKIGTDIKEIFVTEENRCRNPDGLNELNAFVKNISNTPNEFEVFVVDKKTVNAVALPGGTIVIYRGLLDKFTNPDELVFILGHEMGHLEHNHHKFQFIMGALLSHISSKFLTLMQLKNSREGEIEADTFGYNLMLANNIDPKYGIDAFTKLKSEDDFSNKTEKLLSYISTHPAINDRIAIIKEKILNISDNKKVHFKQSISDESWEKIQNICLH